MIRFIFAAIVVGILLIVSIPFLLIEFLIGLKWPKARAKSSLFIVRLGFRVIKWCVGVKVIVKGLENIPPDKAVLFVPNHRSVFDIVLTCIETPVPLAYVAKLETKNIPIFSTWMSFINCLFLDRKDLRKGLEMVISATDLINNGNSVCIFPEGTRNRTAEDLIAFHDGSLKIAERAKCPVIPVAINNSASIWEAQFPKVKRSTVIIEYCKPLNPTDYGRNETRRLSLDTQDAILEAYRRNCELIRK